MEQWQFIQSADGYWHWQHSNEAHATRLSGAGFPTRADCVANAIYHGYVPRSSDELDAPLAA